MRSAVGFDPPDHAAARTVAGCSPLPADGLQLWLCTGADDSVDRDVARPALVLRPAQAIRAAYPGLITSLISASRSSKPRNADFIALTVNHCRSAQP